MSNMSSWDDLPATSTINPFLYTCILNADYRALEQHLVNHTVQQSDLDGCLLYGLQFVQKKREHCLTSHQRLQYFRTGTKFYSDIMLDEQKTPVHIICESPEDHHELLDLVFKRSQRTIIDAEDLSGRTALMYAVENGNMNCVKCLIKGSTDVSRGYEYISTFIKGHRLEINSWTPINEAIRLMSRDKLSCTSMPDIVDELLDATVRHDSSCCTSYLKFAIAYRNAYSIEKLIKVGAIANLYAIGHGELKLWELITQIGSVEMLISIKTVFSSELHCELLSTKQE